MKVLCGCARHRRVNSRPMGIRSLTATRLTPRESTGPLWLVPVETTSGVKTPASGINSTAWATGFRVSQGRSCEPCRAGRLMNPPRAEETFSNGL